MLTKQPCFFLPFAFKIGDILHFYKIEYFALNAQVLATVAKLSGYVSANVTILFRVLSCQRHYPQCHRRSPPILKNNVFRHATVSNRILLDSFLTVSAA